MQEMAFLHSSSGHWPHNSAASVHPRKPSKPAAEETGATPRENNRRPFPTHPKSRPRTSPEAIHANDPNPTRSPLTDRADRPHGIDHERPRFRTNLPLHRSPPNSLQRLRLLNPTNIPRLHPHRHRLLRRHLNPPLRSTHHQAPQALRPSPQPRGQTHRLRPRGPALRHRPLDLRLDRATEDPFPPLDHLHARSHPRRFRHQRDR